MRDPAVVAGDGPSVEGGLPRSRPPPRGLKLSLRVKGLAALGILAAYMALVGFVMTHERQKLLSLAISLEQVYERTFDIARTEYAIHHALLRLQTLRTAGPVPTSAGDDMALDLELVQAGLRLLHADFPQVQGDVRAIGELTASAREDLSPGRLRELESTLSDVESRVAAIDQLVRSQHQGAWSDYYRVYEGMTLIAVSALLLGILAFGGIVSLFFSRLAWDIERLGERAGQIVAGYRGDPLPVTRTDEVGRLTESVNRVQSELRRQERQLEIVRQQRFHQEKMAAVGSLASVMAHEINNPIAAISGIARSIAASGKCDSALEGEFSGDGPQMILEQTERISAISRQIAEFTRPHSPSPELIDLNRLVRGVCKFTGYDTRLRAAALDLDLDPDLPAVTCVADHVTQVLMNLLINAGDAVKDTGRPPAIVVSTRLEGTRVRIGVADNGHGMGEEVRRRAFEEGFSTKGQAQGLGLGLFLCKALVEADGGEIDIDSQPGTGTTVAFRLPLDGRGAA